MPVAVLTGLIPSTWAMLPRWASDVGRLHVDPQPSPSTGGGERTKPRQLHALLVRHVDGAPQEWNLQGRVQIGKQLPPLGLDGKGGKAVGTYLRRKAAWTQIGAEAEAEVRS
jgi:hypothetical protein